MLASIEQLRTLPRAAEITRTLLKYGLHDLVQSVGLHRVLDQTRELLGWKADAEILAKPLPERLRLAFEALGPTFVKLGQVLASRVDLLPADWIAGLDALHANATPVPFADIEAQLLADLGKPLLDAFESFEKEPRAAASIAQVHYAVLPGGSRVAVKVRRPGIAPIVESDLRLLETLAEWLEEEDPAARRFQPRELARQLRKSILRELDFAAEARGQQRFAESFRAHPDVVIPRVHAAFTRPSLLVMDWVDGVPGTELSRANAAGLDCKVLAARGADAVLKMVLVDGLFHADPHPGNVFYLPGNRLAFIDFGMVGWLSPKRRDELVDLLGAVATRDASAMRDVLLAWADGGRISLDNFSDDLGRLLHLYHRAALSDIRLGTLLDEIAAVMRDHHLALPGDLALLFKTLITLEGLGTQLDPGFKLVEHVTPHVRRLLHERWEPSAVGKRLASQAREAGFALGQVPGIVGRFARQIGDDGVGLKLEVREIDKLTSHLESSVNRLAIGMITAALIVGSAIVLSASAPEKSAYLAVLSIVAIAIAFVNSVWMIVSIGFSSRSRH